MSTDIYYFSGTGNSLHVARELQKRMPEVNLIPTISLLDKNVIETKAETVGFIFPIYMTAVPVPVRKFLKKLDFKSTEYIFAIATHEASPGLANTYLEKILKKKGKNLDSYFTIKMSGNSPKGLMPSFMVIKDWAKRITKEKISELESEVLKKLDSIQEVIMNHEKYPKEDTPNNFFIEHIIPLLTEHTNTEIHFYPDSDCTGCRRCEKVCLSKKIKIVDGKPVWQKNVKCYYCYACFNFCPTQSILIKNSYTDKNGRYYHPEVTADDIARQKE